MRGVYSAHSDGFELTYRYVWVPYLRVCLSSHRYNDDISLEDAIHTALLTLKEGFEGHMTEKTIEIGVVTVPSEADLAAGKIEGTGRVKPTFRKLTEEEVRDYLAM